MIDTRLDFSTRGSLAFCEFRPSTRAQPRASDEASSETHRVQAYLPASQPQAEEHPWLPRAHGHPWWPQGPLEPPQEGPQAPHGRDTQEVRSQRRLALVRPHSSAPCLIDRLIGRVDGAARPWSSAGSTRSSSRPWPPGALHEQPGPARLAAWSCAGPSPMKGPRTVHEREATPRRSRGTLRLGPPGPAHRGFGAELSKLGFPQDPSGTWKTPKPRRSPRQAMEVTLAAPGDGSSQHSTAFAVCTWTSGIEV
jgi:hypothetical protein